MFVFIRNKQQQTALIKLNFKIHTFLKFAISLRVAYFRVSTENPTKIFYITINKPEHICHEFRTNDFISENVQASSNVVLFIVSLLNTKYVRYLVIFT